jgi:putative DNA primase/helicase
VTFEQTLIAAGFIVKRAPVDDGKWHRCATEDHPKKRNGAFKLEIGGAKGWWRNWALDSTPNTWRAEGEVTVRPVDRARIEARRREERQRRQRAVEYARQLWADGAPYAGHKYLTDKGLSALGCNVLRVWEGIVWVDEQQVQDRWLLVPMYLRGQLVNVQRIGTTGIKRQIAAAPQIGACLELPRRGYALTVLVEGLATGLAVFQTVKQARVLVTFYADNLARVADEIRPTGSVVVAADNDWQTAARGKGNPGIDKAQNVTELLGCGVAWPKGIEGSDWCDAMKEWGERAPARMQREIVAQAKFIHRREAA